MNCTGRSCAYLLYLLARAGFETANPPIPKSIGGYNKFFRFIVQNRYPGKTRCFLAMFRINSGQEGT